MTHVSLRIVTVILLKRSQEFIVPALLDDGSTKTYINNDVAAELNLCGKKEKVKVNELNCQV